MQPEPVEAASRPTEPPSDRPLRPHRVRSQPRRAAGGDPIAGAGGAIAGAGAHRRPPEQSTGRTPPPLAIKLEVDFDAREARVALGDGEETVRLDFNDGGWRVSPQELDG